MPYPDNFNDDAFERRWGHPEDEDEEESSSLLVKTIAEENLRAAQSTLEGAL